MTNLTQTLLCKSVGGSMRMLSGVLLFVLLLGQFVVPAWAMDVCISGRSPYEYSTPNGYKGSSVEIVREALKRMGVSYRFVEKPWARGLKETPQGKCGMLLSGVWDKDRALVMQYSEPVGCVAWNFYSTSPATKLEGVWGGVHRFSYPEALLEQVTHMKRDIDALTQEILIQKLQLGRVACVAIEHGSAQVLEKQLAVRLYPIGRMVYVPLYVLFPLHTSEEFVTRFNAVLGEMRNEGLISMINQRYGGECPVNPSRKGTVVKSK